MTTYTTIMGDTWDGIAFKVYGQGARMTTLMIANQEHIETVIFSEGILLEVPEIKDEANLSLPPWRRGGAL